MQQEKSNKTIIKVTRPTLHPEFVNIGYGNPRYNSMVVCEDGNALVTCGPSLRKVDLRNDNIIWNKQIGQSQIFNIIENEKYIVTVNFEGFITFLQKKELTIIKQFYAKAKEIRHSALSNKYFVVSCELTGVDEQAEVQIFLIEDIQTKEQIKPVLKCKGFYYYPQIISQDEIALIEFHDPNPKGRSRVETVMEKKKPVIHKLIVAKLNDFSPQKFKQIGKINFQGQILCASQNKISKQIFYIHSNRNLTIFNYATKKYIQTQITASSSPHCVQAYKNGIIYDSKSSQLTYLYIEQDKIQTQKIQVKSAGIGGNFSIKAGIKQGDFYLFNENGLHFYEGQTKKTYTQTCFDITNCGVSLNQNGTMFAVADFGGNAYVFSTQDKSIVPHPISKAGSGIPVRSLAWCYDTNQIIIGCVGGTLFKWDGVSPELQFAFQYDHTVNIVRYYKGFIILGTSDGFVHILLQQTYEQLYKFQAHFPIHYENQKDRELFGSMKNYAEIWSIIPFPSDKENIFYIVTASQDQSQKVFLLTFNNNGTVQHQQKHHLVGHSLAVTSIDWKNMGKGLDQVYVSCSDDKIVRFRNPQNMFEIVHELETSTIKQWHTLTYLALEPNGHRVAIGSQNGYLFIFDIQAKELLFGQKIHLGGIQGLDWKGNKLITCSSDLCISVITL